MVFLMSSYDFLMFFHGFPTFFYGFPRLFAQLQPPRPGEEDLELQRGRRCQDPHLRCPGPEKNPRSRQIQGADPKGSLVGGLEHFIFFHIGNNHPN